MFTKLYLTFILTGLLILASERVMAQVRVTGHVSAEVVESVSAYNDINPQLQINRDQDAFALGNINVAGTSNTTFDVNVEDARIYNEGSNYSLQTRLDNTSGFIADNSGKQSLALTAMLDRRIKGGDYSGNVTVIVSYN
jgi:hypothetical protein